MIVFTQPFIDLTTDKHRTQLSPSSPNTEHTARSQEKYYGQDCIMAQDYQLDENVQAHLICADIPRIKSLILSLITAA